MVVSKTLGGQVKTGYVAHAKSTEFRKGRTDWGWKGDGALANGKSAGAMARGWQSGS